MLRFVVRKLAHVVLVLFLVSLATMLMVDLSPGDPAYAILGDNATPEQVALINEELGLDDPLLVRWANWAATRCAAISGRPCAPGSRSATPCASACQRHWSSPCWRC